MCLCICVCVLLRISKRLIRIVAMLAAPFMLPFFFQFCFQSMALFSLAPFTFLASVHHSFHSCLLLLLLLIAWSVPSPLIGSSSKKVLLLFLFLVSHLCVRAFKKGGIPTTSDLPPPPLSQKNYCVCVCARSSNSTKHRVEKRRWNVQRSAFFTCAHIRLLVPLLYQRVIVNAGRHM